MITLDASVLIAYLSRRDAHHEAAIEILASAVPPLLVHPITLAEALVGPVRLDRGREVMDHLAAVGVVVDETPTDPLSLAELRNSTGCKLPDCCVLLTARRHRTPIGTFDVRLRRAADHGV